MEKKDKKNISWRDFGLARIALIALAGVFLLAVNVAQWRGEETASKEDASAEVAETTVDYAQKLENRLVGILQKVDGVGQVEVMVTLSSSGESILNKDVTEETQTSRDGAGEEEKTENVNKREEETVLADASGAEAPYIIKQMEPEIAGVVIVCEGADNNTVAAAVMEAAQVACNVASNRIKILKMEVQP